MEIVRSVMSGLGFDPVIFFSQLALFYLLHLLLTPILYRPMEKSRDERDALTKGRVKDAESLNTEALKLKQQYEAEIRAARTEALQKVQEAQKEAESQRMELLEKARADAEAVIRETHEAIAQERAKAQSEMADAVPNLAVQVSVKLAKGIVSGDHKVRLLKLLEEVRQRD